MARPNEQIVKGSRLNIGKGMLDFNLWPPQPTASAPVHEILRNPHQNILNQFSERRMREHLHLHEVADDGIYEMARERLDNFRKIRELRERLLARSTFA
jgi:hypothetical protein